MVRLQLWLIYKGVFKLLKSFCCFLETLQLNQTAGCAAERNQFSHQTPQSGLRFSFPALEVPEPKVRKRSKTAVSKNGSFSVILVRIRYIRCHCGSLL